MERTELPIAVFDSGLGGISVLRALVQRLPGEDFLYFGDSANAPYGVRPVAEVRRLTQDVIGRLYDRGIKAAVIACNTATSAAIGPLRAAFPDIPVIGIEPALKPAVAHHRRVLVLATPLTLREEKFVALMHQCAGCAEIVPLPCPELVEFVERGELDSPALTAYLARQLGPYAGRVDAAVLGCTHFPFARRAIRAALGGNVTLYDGSDGTAAKRCASSCAAAGSAAVATASSRWKTASRPSCRSAAGCSPCPGRTDGLCRSNAFPFRPSVPICTSSRRGATRLSSTPGRTRRPCSACRGITR